MEKFIQTKKILADDVNMFRKLRLSTFMRWLQEISIAHTEELGQGRVKTLDKGALWILTRVKIKFYEVPNYDDVVNFESWPSDTMHVIFPRNYCLKSENKPLIKASAVWLLMDEKTRKMVFPKTLDVEINGLKTGEEIEMPMGVNDNINFENATETFSKVKVDFRDVDINCHLNSSRYLDFFDNILGKEYLENHNIKSLEIDFLNEAKLNDEILIKTTFCKKFVLMTGSINDILCFKIKATF